MSKNCRRIIVLMLLIFLSNLCFAQPEPSETRSPGYVKEQRKLKNWWDEPTAARVLKLEKEQVAALAKLQEDLSKILKENSEKRKEQEKLLGQAILAGDVEKVTSLKKAMVDMASADTTRQIEFKISGLAVLDKQQLVDIAARYPEVLDKKWGLRTKGMTRSKAAKKRQQGAHLVRQRQVEDPPEKADQQ